MKMGMTGTRKGCTSAQLRVARELLTQHKPKSLTHGAAHGADSELHNLAGELGIPRVIYPANGVPSNVRNLDIAGTDVRMKAGPPLERNRWMVDSVDMMMGFPSGFEEELRSGTWAAIRYCRKVHRPLVIVWPDGRQEFSN